MIRFWGALAAAFAATLVGLGSAGFAISRALVAPPPQKLMTAAFEMEVADGWFCHQEGTEFVCEPGKDPPHDAIAIVAMKLRGPSDTLAAYEEHLSTPQPALDDERPGRVVAPHSLTHAQLAGYDWVEALFLGSEVPNYYTYYAATITSEIGILVTLSVERDFLERRQRELDQMLNSLIVYQRRA